MRFALRAVLPIAFAALLAAGRAAADPKIEPPRLVEKTEAPYPKAAESERLAASVVVLLSLDDTGHVVDVKLTEGAGHGFDEAAIEAAKKFVYAPATVDGAPIAAKVSYRFEFVPPPPTVGALRGSVRVAGQEDAPLLGAQVTITTDAGPVGAYAVTNDGTFEAPALSPGHYRVTITAAGFDTVSADEVVFVGKRTEAIYRLKPTQKASSDGAIDLYVVGERPPREVTVHTLEQRELERIPGTNGDALKSIQSLPGVGRSPGLGSLLIVRGAAPQDTQVFVEGVPIPIVYHFGGISSVIPTEMLERIDFRPGNFGTEYGRVMGGIIDVRTIAAPTDGKFHALAQADFIDARFVAKGPIPFLHDWAFVAAARRSYVDLWLKPILSSRGAGFTAAPIYYDWQAFAETHPTVDSRVRFGFYGSDDRLEIFRDTVNTRDPADSGDLGLHTAFGRFQGSYEGHFSNTIKLHQVLAYGWDVMSFQNGDRNTSIVQHPLTDRSELSFELAKGYTLHLGADVLYTTTKVDLTAPPPRNPGEPSAGNAHSFLTENSAPTYFQPAMYSEMEMQFSKRLRVVPGFRVDYVGATRQWNTSPRVSARYDLIKGKDTTTLKGGAGVFYQPPRPQEISSVFGTPGLLSNRAFHYSIGIEQSVMRRVEISVEGFYKKLDQLVARVPDSTGGFSYDNLGSGSVIGSEVLIRYKPDDRFFGWIAYTLSRSVRSDPVQGDHLFQYDQTHILTVLGSYRLGGGWEIGARFRFVSGNLFTPCNGGALDGSTGNYSCVSGAPFSARLPPFHQLDIRVDKHWYYRDWQLSLYLDLQNAYNRGNPEGIAYNFDYSQKIYQTGLPIIPSLGVRGEL